MRESALRSNVKLYASQWKTKKNKNKFLQTVHMFGMLIYISFLFGLVLRFSPGGSCCPRRGFQDVFKRRIGDEIEATTHKHTAVNFPHFIRLVKGILKGTKGLFS